MRLSLLFLLCVAACSRAPAPSQSASAPVAVAATVAAAAAGQPDQAQVPEPQGVAWRKGDVDAAFAEARAAQKPVFLYWGATWCPPCNQVKATIFNRQDFIERSKAFVAVYIDGDGPNAQQLGARFKVSGYPSMLLFDSAGAEITRLPGEVDARRYMDVLAAGMNNGQPVRKTLQAALTSPGSLTEQGWRMLAYYSWETDEQQLIPKGRIAQTLTELSVKCPAQYADASERLALEALNARATAKNGSTPDGSSYALLSKVLADPTAARNNFDILTDAAGATASYATRFAPAQRVALVHAWDSMLEKTSNDPTLSQTDRLGAVDARVELARLDDPKGALAPALTEEVNRQVARADRETTNAYERQSVVNAAAATLADAGLLDASDTLLKAELSRSHSPYYFMVDLARNAKARGDKAAAIDWYEQAYRASEGPATRLQWGVIYVRGLIDLIPDDEKRIEQAAQQVIGELAGNPDVLYERNRASLTHLGHELDAWNNSGKHTRAVAAIHATLSPICAQATEDARARAECTRFFYHADASA